MEGISDRWLSRQELADRLGVPPKTTAQWATKGTGPPHAKIGRHVRYRLSDVIKWEDQRISQATRHVETPVPGQGLDIGETRTEQAR
ncbi:helix-turn-helix domain-containing protein [Mycolicibacterium sp.]|uniref:helix-turn-helix transcriptional regulator n=1 Tax=Mycolicibacterium sp. TaxID=2320850 RepID=UPI001A1F92BA|nr:helix-turn-helix domain-containing protein [Mycolicibacterium sp.]MBJ7336052.1 helix-turn-helix domain-containing protein [Mycolicibacterium sp.]